MKKIYVGLVALVVTCLVVGIGCRKNAQDVQGAANLTAEILAKDASFFSLNEAISRFDPEYLVKVYGDRRSIQELTNKSKELLTRLQQDPNNSQAQDQLAGFYHFRNTDQLKEYSARISITLKELDSRYGLSKTLLVPGGGALYAKARVLFVKDKYEQLQRGDPSKGEGTKRTNLWLEFVETEASNFGEWAYYNPDDQSFEGASESGGGGCNGEICCLKNEVCRAEALSSFYGYLVLYGVGGIYSGGKLGAVAGSPAPGLGNGLGALIGGIFGGVSGTAYAYIKYRADLDICKAKFQVCLAEKKTNP